MSRGKILQILLVATLLAGMAASASAVSSTSGSTGMPSGYETQSFSDKYIPDLGGMLAVTSSQQSKRQQLTDRVITDRTATFELTEGMCVESNFDGAFGWLDPIFGGGTQHFNDATLWLGVYEDRDAWEAHKNGEDVQREVIKMKDSFTATEGECYEFTSSNTFVSENVAFNGKDDYFVATEISWRKPDNNELYTLNQEQYETGTITFLPPQEQFENPAGDIVLEGLEENKQGEYPVAKVGEQITFKSPIREGSVEDVERFEWKLVTDDQAGRNQGATFYGSNKQTFSYTFEEPGRVAAELNIESVDGSSWGTMTHIVVRDDNPDSPNAEITGVPDEVDQGETFYVSSDSSDPDGKILHTRWSNGNINTESTEYVFNEAGRQTIELTVTDTQGLKDTTTTTVQVKDTGREIPEPPGGGGGTNGGTQEEICGDGIDNDNDGQVDEGCTEPNRPPIAESIDAPTTATVGDTVTVEAQYTDRDDPDRELTVEWSNGDTGDQTTYQVNQNRDLRIYFTVDDGEATDRVERTVSVNRKDSDSDGIIDVQDDCPEIAGNRENGCPVAPQPSEPNSQQLEKTFQSQIQSVVQTSSFLNFLNAAQQADTVDADAPVRETLRAGSSDYSPDRTFEDGTVTQLYGKKAVIEEGGNTSYESDWVALQESTYSQTFERSFDTSGNRAYYLTVYEVDQRYNYDNQNWTTTDIRKIDSEKYLFEVSGSSTSGNETGTGGSGGGGFTPPEGGLFGDSSSVYIVGGALLLILLILGVVVYNKRQG